MEETSPPQIPFPKPPGSLSDKLIRLNVQTTEVHPPHKRYAHTLNPHPDSKSNLPVIEERKLPIIKEAIQALKAAKNEKKNIHTETNPFGTKSKAILYLFGDLHLSGSQPSQSVRRLSPLQNLLIEKGAKTRAYAKQGEAWFDDIRAQQTIEAYWGLEQALRSDISTRTSFLDTRTAVGLIDIGDRMDTEATAGDDALTTYEMEMTRRRLESQVQHLSSQPTDSALMSAYLDGNHDTDINNKGISVEQYKRDLYGSQIFAQEIGENHLVLALNTNFASRFWYDSLEIAAKSAPPEMYSGVKAVIDQLQAEYEVQQKLIDSALKSGKNIILIGHELTLLKDLLDLQNSRVTHIVAGHSHTPKNLTLKTKNNQGRPIRYLEVGASMTGAPGSETFSGPTAYALTIDESQPDPVRIDTLTVPEHTWQIREVI